MLKRAASLFAIVILAISIGAAQNSSSTYLVVGPEGQGIACLTAGLASASPGATVTWQSDEMSMAAVLSSDPQFPAQVAQICPQFTTLADMSIQWVRPEEIGGVVDVDFAVDDSAAAPQGSSSALPAANHETFSGEQWSLVQIHADQTAANGDRGHTVTRARVAVIDTGILVNHVDIRQNLNVALSRSFNPVEPSFSFPENGRTSHATLVAGTIAAPINGVGTQGVAPDAELVMVKALADSGNGPFSAIIAAIDYASGPLVHADVINMSLNTTFDRNIAGAGSAVGRLIAALNRAVSHATARGSLVVSAAGNDGADLNGRLFSVPAQSGNGMAVSATGPVGFGVLGFNANFDRLASYSNFGQSVIDVAAPGGDAVFTPSNQLCPLPGLIPGVTNVPCFVLDFVIAPGRKNGSQSLYSLATGTSLAAPHVSGIAALIVGKFGHMSPAQLKALVEQSADAIGTNPGADASFGKGRVNALKALQQ